MTFIDQMLGLVYVMLALAIIIALLGIGNTLALSILERTREVGVLRAVGMTRAQLRSTIRWESVIIALQGTVLGLAVGTFFGWALVAALHDEGVDRLAVPYVTLAAVVAVAAWQASSRPSCRRGEPQSSMSCRPSSRDERPSRTTQPRSTSRRH